MQEEAFFLKESRLSSSYYKRYEECITLFGLTLDASDNIVIFKTTCTCFFLSVLEVCGCNRRLLSALGAVGSLFFHSTVTQQPDISSKDRRIIIGLSNKD